MAQTLAQRMARPGRHRPHRQLIPPPAPPGQTMTPAPVTHPTRTQPAGGGEPAGIDYSNDPILQQVRALVQQQIASAEAGAQAARSQALIRYGFSPETAGLYGDQATAAAAKANPFSALAVLARSHEQRSRALDRSLSDPNANLFYSTYAGQQHQREGTQYLGEQVGAQSNLQDLLTGISGGLVGARSAGQERMIQAEQDAYQRALDYALKYGTSGPVAGQTQPRTPTGGALAVQQRTRPRRRPPPRVAHHPPRP